MKPIKEMSNCGYRDLLSECKTCSEVKELREKRRSEYVSKDFGERLKESSLDIGKLMEEEYLIADWSKRKLKSA